MTPYNCVLEPQMLGPVHSLDPCSVALASGRSVLEPSESTGGPYAGIAIKAPRVCQGKPRLLPPDDGSFVPGKISLEMKLSGVCFRSLAQAAPS